MGAHVGGAADETHDPGPEFVAKAVQGWIAAVGAKTADKRAGLAVGERLRRELQRQAP